MILKEYRCRDCQTVFESWEAEPECPTCTAQEAERHFETAPAIRSAVTNFKDHTVRQLAEDYGLSDVNNKHGQAVRTAPAPAQAPSFQTGNPQAQAMLAKLGGNADSFSPVLPMLQSAGRPHQWAKTPERRK